MSGLIVGNIPLHTDFRPSYKKILGDLPVQKNLDRSFVQNFIGQFEFGKLLKSGCNGSVWTAANKMDPNSEIVVKVFDTSKLNLATLRMIELECNNLNKCGYKSQVFLDRKTSKLYLTMPDFGRTDAGLQLKKLSLNLLSSDKKTALKAFLESLMILEAILISINKFHTLTELVHGDAWMENFMINIDNENVTAHVIDFGACCSKGMTYEEYESKHIVGTGSFHTSPEIPCKSIDKKYICKTEKISEKSDLHAIFADFVFRTVVDIYDHYDDGKGGINTCPIHSFIEEFMNFSLQQCCNSASFAALMGGRLQEIARNNKNKSPKDRCEVVTATEFVQALIQKIKLQMETDTDTNGAMMHQNRS